jgi:hypothetical protein
MEKCAGKIPKTGAATSLHSILKRNKIYDKNFITIK